MRTSDEFTRTSDELRELIDNRRQHASNGEGRTVVELQNITDLLFEILQTLRHSSRRERPRRSSQ
jgi:hypothetical protein